jgi:hypothetical protein
MNALKKSLLWLAFSALVALAVYLWALRENPALATRMAEVPTQVQEVVAPGSTAVAPPAPVDARIEEPAPAALPDPALPLLEASDSAAASELKALLGDAFFSAMLEPHSLLRRIVVTLDNLPNDRLSMKYRVVRAVPGEFAVSGLEPALTISEANAARYDALLQALLAADAAHWVALYRQWYPLLQQAYAEMADPRDLFNDRVLAVIDHLLAVQVPASALPLTHPGVLYRYADPALEAKSAGAKILYRMGAAHAAKVQARLREIRALLASSKP